MAAPSWAVNYLFLNSKLVDECPKSLRCVWRRADSVDGGTSFGGQAFDANGNLVADHVERLEQLAQVSPHG